LKKNASNWKKISLSDCSPCHCDHFEPNLNEFLTVLAQTDRFRPWLMPKNYFWDILVKIQWKLKFFFGCLSIIHVWGIVRDFEKRFFIFIFYRFKIFFLLISQKNWIFSKKISSLKFKKSSLLVCCLCHCDHFKSNLNKLGPS